MPLILKQFWITSKHSPHDPKYLYQKDKFNFTSTLSDSNYQSYEKSYYRQPRLFNCPSKSQSDSESDEHYLDYLTKQKNVATITPSCKHCLPCSATNSVRELNRNLYGLLPVNSEDLIISNMSSDSDGECSSGTYLKSNATMNKTLPNISSGEYDERSRCRKEENGSCSSSMTSGRQLTPTVVRTGGQRMYNNFHHDYHQHGEVGIEEDKIISQEQGSLDDESTNCNLVLKVSTVDLVNSELEKFNDDQYQTFAQCNIEEKSLSLTELDKPFAVITKKKQNRLPFTICDNNEKYLKIFHHNCVNNVTAMNINQNTVETRETEANTLKQKNNDKSNKSSSLSNNKMFRSWIKSITRMFSTSIKKKNCQEENSNIEILFQNNECPYSSSELNINNQINCCNRTDDKMEFCLKKRFRKLNRDNLWIQDIIPVYDSSNTDSRYSLFLIKKAQDKITVTDNSRINLPSAKQCAECQCLLVTPSLTIDAMCQQLNGNSSNKNSSNRNSFNGEKKIKASRKKLSQQCFCFRIWHSFCQESENPTTRNP